MKNKGFTILETLVAITILLIAITGPLTIAEKSLISAISSQDQLTASYLAQDLMEYIKNVRDDNLLDNSAGGWLNSYGVNFAGCTGGSPCDFDTENGSAATAVVASCTVVTGNLCQTYLDSTKDSANSTVYYYSPASGGTKTKFSRAFTIAVPGGGTASSTTSSVVVTVTVNWSSGTIANQVVLQDILFNTGR